MRISDRSSDVCSSDLAEIGYPLVVRPSYVLGGRAMEIVHEQQDLERYMREAVKVSNDSPVLLDRFLNNATEVDVDCLADGATVFIETGRASCRERVCQYVSITVGAVS